MEDCTVYSDLTSVAEGLLAGSKKPIAKFFPSVGRLHLLIIFKIVADDKSWAGATPLAASYLLLRTTRQYAKLVSIKGFDDDVSLLVGGKLFNFEVCNKRVVLSELICYVS